MVASEKSGLAISVNALLGDFTFQAVRCRRNCRKNSAFVRGGVLFYHLCVVYRYTSIRCIYMPYHEYAMCKINILEKNETAVRSRIYIVESHLCKLRRILQTNIYMVRTAIWSAGDLSSCLGDKRNGASSQQLFPLC